MKDILVIGHRGAKGHLAENTIESFQKAVDLGCDGIEFDVRSTRDGIPIIFHDDTLQRIFRIDGVIEKMDLVQVQKLKVGEFMVPTLQQVLHWASTDLLLNIEIKSEAALESVERIVSQSIRKGRNNSKLIVSSFNWNVLQELRRKNPDILIGVITSTDLDLALGFAKFIRAESIHPHFHLLTKHNCQEIKRSGIKIMCWTVNETSDIEQMKYLEVDGIITDYPDRV